MKTVLKLISARNLLLEQLYCDGDCFNDVEKIMKVVVINLHIKELLNASINK